MLEFEERLSLGKSFEEDVSRFLTGQGFPIGLHISAQLQWKFGESAAHCEIKFDQLWQKYGNLFIETRERRNSNGTSYWRMSGIHDESKPWFYLIGDRTKLWLLAVTFLIRCEFSNKYQSKKTETAEGFVIPVDVADKWAIRIFTEWFNAHRIPL